MKAFKIYPSETTVFSDRITGVSVQKLTNYRGHSVHPYFTDDGWFANGKKMLFMSDRGNVHNMHSIDLESGEIAQLTDFRDYDTNVTSPMAVNHLYNETYYAIRGCVYALNLDNLETRPMYIIPKGFHFGGARPTGDGKAVVAGLTEDMSATIKANLAAGYIGFEDTFDARPDCRIIRIGIEDNSVDEVWQEKCWVGHINPSPVKGNLLTFCHEGPWDLVDHRIWMLDLDTGKVLKLRERKSEGEQVGHEYWFLDGEHVGYQAHGRSEDGSYTSASAFGFVRYDGTGQTEAPAVRVPGPDHVHSIDFNFVVSDTGKSIKGYKYNGSNFDGPRIITMHDGSFDWGSHHPHPQVTKDGKNIVYNSTASGYCNIYMAPVPDDFYALPELTFPDVEH